MMRSIGVGGFIATTMVMGICALGLAVTTVASPRAPADPPATTGDPASNTLMGMLPSGFTADNCKASSPPSSAVLEEVDCDQNTNTGGPIGAVFFRFGNRNSMAAPFRSLSNATRLATCPDSDPSPTTWHRSTTTTQVAGLLLCGTDPHDNTAAVLIWTDNTKLILGSVEGSDIAGLYQWWAAAG
jgi:hypothetical protein